MALTDAKVKAARARGAPYKLADGGQLYLHVTTAGSRLWRMNYAFAGKQRTLTIGPYPIVTLAEAREARDAAKRLLLQGRDPSLEKKLAVTVRADAAENNFAAVAGRWFEVNKPRWSAHHAADVLRSLERDVFPAIGAMPITDLKPPRILAVLTAIQKRGSIETAHRVQQRMSAVFAFGIAAGVAEQDPAAGVRKALLPVENRGKQPSIVDGLDQLHEFIAASREVIEKVEERRAQIVTKLAHRFLALTSVRPGTVHGARWDELIDVDLSGFAHGPFRPVWRIPGARMKGKKARKREAGGDHQVPLSAQAVDVLVLLYRLTGRGELMFPNHWNISRPISENGIASMLNRAGYKGRHCPHGWRAAFSTTMNERAKRLKNHGDRAVIELMLAHVPENKVAGAYDRAAFMERRRELAQEWADLIMSGRPAAAELLGMPVD